MSIRKELVITRPGFAGALRKTGTYAHISNVTAREDGKAMIHYDYRDIETHEVYMSRSFTFTPNHEAPRSIKDQAYDHMMNDMEEFEGGELSDDSPEIFGQGMADRVNRDV